MAYELSKDAATRARKAFLQVLEAAVPAYEVGQLELFPNEDEAIIRREVERKLHRPKLPNAGETEREWVTRLKAMSFPEYWRRQQCVSEWTSEEGEEKKGLKWLCARAAQAAAKWAELLPRDQYDATERWRENPGRYYFRHPVTPKTDGLAFKWLTELKRAALETQEWEVKWFAQMILDGLPESASDFAMDALCGLRRWNGDVLRIVNLRNIIGERASFLVLEADEFKSPEAFRQWCLEQGSFNWHGNQTHLQDLHEDVGRHIAWRIVNEVDACGWHALPNKDLPPGECDGIWFYARSAYYRGRTYQPDRDKLFWITVATGRNAKNEEVFEEQGFFLTENGRENSEFMQGRPDMKPERAISQVLQLREIAEWVNRPEPRPVAERTGKTTAGQPASHQALNEVAALYSDFELLRAFFREVCFRFNESVGGMEGYLGVGAMLSYLAAPEIFARKKLFPGVFVHGQMQSGKGTFCEWLMALHGFYVSAGTGNKATPVGILQQAQNYCNLPVWVDEFRENLMGDVVAILRDAFNRQTSPKWVPPDGIHRKIKTMFLVSGETTCSDAATRSRFSHIQVSQAKRKEAQERGAGDHFEWFQQNKHHFFLLTRYVLEHRAEFVEKVFQFLESWQGFTELKGVGDRDKIAHGIHWASWVALCAMLGSHDANETGEFRRFMIENTKVASREVIQDTNVAMFFRDLLNCFKAGEIDLECFKVSEEDGEYPEGRRFSKVKLFIDPDATIASVGAYLRKQGEKVSLRRNDLMAQMSKEPYWIPGKHRRRFSKGSESTACWGFDLDHHPMGRQPVTEESYEAALDDRQKGLGEAIGEDLFKDGDPRKGPLYAIAHALIEREAEKRQEARAHE